MNARRGVLVIENAPSDVIKAIQVLQRLNIHDPGIITNVSKALLYLEDVASGEKQPPELIVLDLDFDLESGFEILRFRKANPVLQQCKILVWTVMGDREKELCRLFGVPHIVSKHDGEAALESALKNCLVPPPQNPMEPTDKSKSRAKASSA